MVCGKIRAAFRLLLALSLLGWGQFVWAANYSWTLFLNGYPSQFSGLSSPQQACEKLNTVNNRNLKITTLRVAETSFQCFEDGSESRHQARRAGDSCPGGGAYNPDTGTCAASCKTTSMTVAQECVWVESTKTAVCPDKVSVNSCGYLPSGKSNTRCYTSAAADPGKKLCVMSYTGTGEASQENNLPEGTYQEQENEDPNKTCVTMADSTKFCYTNSDKGCGTFNGKEGCFQTDQNCGYANGTFTCVNTGSNSRNCGYANGQQVCFNPKDPTKIIDPSSSDHPINGGNGDGDDTNDPRPAGSGSSGSTGNSQGSDSAATNKAIQDAADGISQKQDKTNDLLGDIKGLLEDLMGEGEGEYQGEQSGDGTGQGPGEDSGGKLGDLIKDESKKAFEERDELTKNSAVAANKAVDTFLPNAENLFRGSMLDTVLPAAQGCAPYIIKSSLGKYQFTISIDVCFLSRAKALLEWVFWVLTLIGLFMTIKRIAFLESDGGQTSRR